MRIWRLIFTLFCTCIGLGLLGLQPRHGVYISFSKWYTSPSQDTLHANLRVFANDLENALMYQKGSQKQIDFQSPEGRATIEAYVASKIQLELNGRASLFSLQSLELQQEVLSMMLAVPLEQETLTQVELANHLLLELFPSQLNIIQFQVGTDIRYAKLDLDQTQVRWDF